MRPSINRGLERQLILLPIIASLECKKKMDEEEGVTIFSESNTIAKKKFQDNEKSNIF